MLSRLVPAALVLVVSAVVWASAATATEVDEFTKLIAPQKIAQRSQNMGLGEAAPADFFSQGWTLNSKLSHVYMQTVKKNALFETHNFTEVEGNIRKDGRASIIINLASLSTGIDIRNVRMRFLLFETFKFPAAEVTANLEKALFQDLQIKNRLIREISFTLNLHGIKRKIVTNVVVTRIFGNAVSVATVKPIIVNASDFGLTEGVAKLAEAAGGLNIVPAASITFDLIFEGTNFDPEAEAAAIAAARLRARENDSRIDVDACETRLSVISKTRAIYFDTASAELDQKREPLLNRLAEIVNRCEAVGMEVSGHTDSDGNKASNQNLSERRARAIVDYLAKRGVTEGRIRAIGYGDTRPVVSNDTPKNKAKNRRIEFRVVTGATAN